MEYQEEEKEYKYLEDFKQPLSYQEEEKLGEYHSPVQTGIK